MPTKRFAEISAKWDKYLDRIYTNDNPKPKAEKSTTIRKFKNPTGVCQWEGCGVVFVRQSSNQRHCKVHQKLLNTKSSKAWYYRNKAKRDKNPVNPNRKKYTFKEK